MDWVIYLTLELGSWCPLEIKLTQPPKPIEDGKMGAADWQRDTRSIIISLRAIANTLILKVLKNLFFFKGFHLSMTHPDQLYLIKKNDNNLVSTIYKRQNCGIRDVTKPEIL